MSAMNGWVKLYRQFLDWEWAGDPKMVALFVRLLILASNRDTTWQGVELKRGEAVVGLHALSSASGVSVRGIRTCLSRLELSGEIIKKSTNKFTVLTICNYEKYQATDTDQRQTNDKQTTNKRQHREKLRNKENNSYDDDPRFVEFWQRYPRKEKKPAALRAWTKQKCGNGLFNEVMTGLERYLAGPWKGKDTQYIPHPSSWLNDQRWNDEIENKEKDDGWLR